MSAFTVDSQFLYALQQGVVGFGEELLNGSVPQRTDVGAITNADGNDNNGTGAIIGEFFAAWSNSLAVTGQNISNVADKLGKAAYAYDETENHVCDMSGGQ